MGALPRRNLSQVSDSGMLAESSPVKTPLPREKWLNCWLAALLCLSLSLAMVLRTLLKGRRGYGSMSTSSSEAILPPEAKFDAEPRDSDAGWRRSRFFGTCKGGNVSVDDVGFKEAQELLFARLRPV